MGWLERSVGMVRCPACGSTSCHPRDLQREAEVREATGELLEEVSDTSHVTDHVLGGMGMSPWGEASVPAFLCNSCGHGFDMEAEVAWYRRMWQIGDERAVAEYREALGRAASARPPAEAASSGLEGS